MKDADILNILLKSKIPTYIYMYRIKYNALNSNIYIKSISVKVESCPF